jgi:hypothetical protein
MLLSALNAPIGWKMCYWMENVLAVFKNAELEQMALIMESAIFRNTRKIEYSNIKRYDVKPTLRLN